MFVFSVDHVIVGAAANDDLPPNNTLAMDKITVFSAFYSSGRDRWREKHRFQFTRAAHFLNVIKIRVKLSLIQLWRAHAAHGTLFRWGKNQIKRTKPTRR